MADTTSQLIDDIVLAYREEYYQKQSKNHPGMIGKINRFFEKVGIVRDRDEKRVLLGGVAVALPLGLLSLAVPFITAPMIIAAAVAGVATALGTYTSVCRATNKALRADIASGILTARYNAEFAKAVPAAASPADAPALSDKDLSKAFDACYGAQDAQVDVMQKIHARFERYFNH